LILVYFLSWGQTLREIFTLEKEVMITAAAAKH
jgi:hypothetical protein